MEWSKAVDPESLKAAGWKNHEPDGFSAQLGTCWIGGTRDNRMLGFLAAAKHTNIAGNVHGGALLTFADICLGYKAYEAGDRAPMVTAQLQMQFVSAARAGDFIIGRPEVIRRTRHIIFVRGLISVGDRVVASTDGIWKVQKSAKGA
jgi:acyl-coenzyme A thioesterase PaaI-like protein